MMNLTLAIPSLNRPSERPVPFDTPGLNALLRFGHFTSLPAETSVFYARHLWRGRPEISMLARLGLPADTPALLAAPVCQQMGMNQAHLASGRALSVTAQEAAQWCAGLNDFFCEDGWRFYPFKPDLWLLTLPKQPDWQVPSVLDMLGQADGMERMERYAAPDWLSKQTEIQMWLHAHPLNAARPMPVNGVWLWPGRSDGQAEAGFTATDSSWLLRPGLPQDAAPYDWAAFEAMLEECGQQISDGLIFLDDLTVSVAADDEESYRQLLADWDVRFFTPIRLALQKGRLKNLTLTTDGEHGGVLNIRTKAERAFWKRKKVFTGTLR